ncbi:MAG: hypothetical protein ACOCXG_05495 [Nanoarchaeota archaeon]
MAFNLLSRIFGGSEFSLKKVKFNRSQYVFNEYDMLQRQGDILGILVWPNARRQFPKAYFPLVRDYYGESVEYLKSKFGEGLKVEEKIVNGLNSLDLVTRTSPKFDSEKNLFHSSYVSSSDSNIFLALFFYINFPATVIKKLTSDNGVKETFSVFEDYNPLDSPLPASIINEVNKK